MRMVLHIFTGYTTASARLRQRIKIVHRHCVIPYKAGISHNRRSKSSLAALRSAS